MSCITTNNFHHLRKTIPSGKESRVETALRIVGSAGIVTVLAVLIRARAAIRHTTLIHAWNWSLAGVLAWSLAGMISWAGAGGPTAQSRIWYAAAVLMVCPLIAVLGAKRPGSRVWTWFVLCPLLIVLGWPLLLPSASGFFQGDFQLETPAVVGYLLVLVMGVGNYLATRFAIPALLLFASLLLLIIPLSTSGTSWFPPVGQSSVWATLCLAAAGGLSVWISSRGLSALQGVDRVWTDYRHWFGIVWAKRIQERVNHTARKEQWPARLELDGLVWSSPHLDPDLKRATEAKIEQTLRWLLRRFVDAEWLDVRFGAETTDNQTPSGSHVLPLTQIKM